MASINYATREISCKIVYYGPGLSGKTTNLQIIHRKIPNKDKSEMVSLATETDRTLFFDFLPLDLGSIKGFSTKFQLYTVPGQVYYNATRKLVLRGVDGVVFVVDSQMDKLQENLESFANLQENLREYGHSIENIPLVLQYNKRDLPDVYPVDQLNSLINKSNLPYYEAVASTGVGVFTTLKGIGKFVIDKFNAKYAGFQGTRRPSPSTPTPVVAPAPQQPKAAPAPQPPKPVPPQSFAPPQAPPIEQGRAPFNMPPAQPQPATTGFSAGSNPFAGNTNFPTSTEFSGAPPVATPNPVQPKPMPMPSQPSPFSAPASSGGFGAGAPPNPFAGGGAANPPPFSGQTGSGGIPKPAFPFAGPKPGGFADAPKPPVQPGIPAPAGNQGFKPPAGGIPISPFVEGFASAKPAFPASPSASGTNPTPPPANQFGGPPPANPFVAPPASPAFGQLKPTLPTGGGFGGGFGTPPSSIPGTLPAPGQPGGYPIQSPDATIKPFPGQAAPSFGAPPSGMPGAFGTGPAPSAPAPGPGFPMMQNKAQGPFPTLAVPTTRSGFLDQPTQGPGAGKGGGSSAPPPDPVDKSGIVSTFEDLGKGESFKTKKLARPNEKKKGFFDGLFKKDK